MRLWIASLLIVAAGSVAADEGMWQPHQLPEIGSELKRLGLEIDPATLTRLSEHPMNAVISLGGCTASFVSPRGLVITNHHCAYGSLQYNSTEERNLLEDGFLAKRLDEELPASPGTRVYVTVGVDDVTDEVLRSIRPIDDDADRYQAIEDKLKQLIADCEKDPGHRCSVPSFHGGLEYYRIKRLEIRDVRIVHAPADSIGTFGGDIDNWMWPRHTGDYSFYRAYVGPDGKPADPAEQNVPYEPKHYLRVAEHGLRDDNFVMVIGYPGSTSRYRLASEVKNTFEWYYPTTKKLVDGHLEVLESATVDRPDAAIKYASSKAGLNNTAKNYQGMIDGYARGGMLERKLERESALQKWIESSDPLRDAYGASLSDLEAAIADNQKNQQRDLILARMGRSSMLSTARQLYRLSREQQKPDAKREPGYQERDMTFFRQRLERLDRRFDPGVDKAIWLYYLKIYQQLPADQRVPAFDQFLGLGDETRPLETTLDSMYARTGLGDNKTRLSMMTMGAKKLEKSDDPFMRLAVAIYDSDREREREDEAMAGRFQKLRPRFMKTMIDFEKSRGKAVYADANSTLRVTYGQVDGYSPKDGIYYTPFTRLEGILEKYTGQAPFDSPPLQLKAIRQKKYGRYALEAIDSVPVNFLSSVDTTGGNSGSPTLDGRGELVGLLFDGTYDSINADWDFNAATTRSIHADMRYVLWVMEYVYDARNLLEELRGR